VTKTALLRFEHYPCAPQLLSPYRYCINKDLEKEPVTPFPDQIVTTIPGCRGTGTRTAWKMLRGGRAGVATAFRETCRLRDFASNCLQVTRPPHITGRRGLAIFQLAPARRTMTAFLCGDARNFRFEWRELQVQYQQLTAERQYDLSVPVHKIRVSIFCLVTISSKRKRIKHAYEGAGS
jgi:hypothetical protein